MKTLIRQNIGEALVGLLVVLLAAWFVGYVWRSAGGSGGAGGTRVTALFPNASGVNVGTDVRVAGIKVGSVSGLSLDPQSYQVRVAVAFKPGVRLPADSSAAITSEGLLGQTFVAFTPGGSPTPLKSGDTVTDTQGSMDLMALIGQFINKPAAGAPAAGGAGGVAPAP